MASRAVMRPVDFCFINIWLLRNTAVGSISAREMSLRDWYVVKCLPSSFAIPAEISEAG